MVEWLPPLLTCCRSTQFRQCRFLHCHISVPMMSCPAMPGGKCNNLSPKTSTLHLVKAFLGALRVQLIFRSVFSIPVTTPLFHIANGIVQAEAVGACSGDGKVDVGLHFLPTVDDFFVVQLLHLHWDFIAWCRARGDLSEFQDKEAWLPTDRLIHSDCYIRRMSQMVSVGR